MNVSLILEAPKRTHLISINLLIASTTSRHNSFCLAGGTGNG